MNYKDDWRYNADGTTKTPRRIGRPTSVGTGGPTSLLLDLWCHPINRAFGSCYLVGSATRTKDRRDVDVACIMGDGDFASLFPGLVDHYSMDTRWSLMCASFSMLATEQTHLPVDFKFQAQTWANNRHGNKRRYALGMFSL